jgi:hypothetical protein
MRPALVLCLSCGMVLRLCQAVCLGSDSLLHSTRKRHLQRQPLPQQQHPKVQMATKRLEALGQAAATPVAVRAVDTAQQAQHLQQLLIHTRELQRLAQLQQQAGMVSAQKLLLSQHFQQQIQWVFLTTVQMSALSWGLNPVCCLAGWFLAKRQPGASAAAVYTCTVYDTDRMRAAVQAAKRQQLSGCWQQIPGACAAQ